MYTLHKVKTNLQEQLQYKGYYRTKPERFSWSYWLQFGSSTTT